MTYLFSSEGARLSLRNIIILIAGILLVAGAGFLYCHNANRYCDIEIEGRMSYTMKPGEQIEVPVNLYNRSNLSLSSRDNCFLSGQIPLDSGIAELPRTAIDIRPGAGASYNLQIVAPDKAGEYKVFVDIVKEHSFWFRERGNNAKYILLKVEN